MLNHTGYNLDLLRSPVGLKWIVILIPGRLEMDCHPGDDL